MTPWERRSGDSWRSLAVWENAVYAVASVAGAWQLERFDPAVTMDGDAGYAAPQALYNGRSVQVAVGGHVFATAAVASGLAGAIDVGAERSIGADFEVQLEPMPPLSQYIGHEVRRVSAWVYFRRRGNVRINGILKSAFRAGDDFAAAPAPRTGSEKEYLLGWKEGKSVTVSQALGEGAPLEVGSVTFDVVH